MISSVKNAMPIRFSTYFVITIRQPFSVSLRTGAAALSRGTSKRQSDQAALPQVFASADYSMVAFLYTRLSATGWNSTPFAPAVIRFAFALVYSGAMTASFMTSVSASNIAAQRAS